MDNISQFTIFNIREFIGEESRLGESNLNQILSEFTCPKNPDVERF